MWTEAPQSLVDDILALIGHQLLSFHISGRSPLCERLEGLWDLCPKMESYQTCPELEPPPPFHPIHTLILDAVEKYKGVILPLPDWPNRRKVKFHAWRRDKGDMEWEKYTPPRDSLRIEDWSGLTLSEYRAQLQSESVGHPSF